MPGYKPREKNVIQEILHDHFKSFEKNYDTQYSKKYGKYRIIHIKETVERFIECGDYSKGIARIKCKNANCFDPISNMTKNLGCLRSRQLEDVSRIISSIITDYYIEVVKTTVTTGVVVSYQSFGDLIRWNPCSSCTAGIAREFAFDKLHTTTASFWKEESMRWALSITSLLKTPHCSPRYSGERC